MQIMISRSLSLLAQLRLTLAQLSPSLFLILLVTFDVSSHQRGWYNFTKVYHPKLQQLVLYKSWTLALPCYHLLWFGLQLHF
jgi:hypothetical protein